MHREQLGRWRERGDRPHRNRPIGCRDRTQHANHRLWKTGHVHLQRQRKPDQDCLLVEGWQTPWTGRAGTENRERQEGGQGNVPVLR